MSPRYGGIHKPICTRILIGSTRLTLCMHLPRSTPCMALCHENQSRVLATNEPHSGKNHLFSTVIPVLPPPPLSLFFENLGLHGILPSKGWGMCAIQGYTAQGSSILRLFIQASNILYPDPAPIHHPSVTSTYMNSTSLPEMILSSQSNLFLPIIPKSRVRNSMVYQSPCFFVSNLTTTLTVILRVPPHETLCTCETPGNPTILLPFLV